ncbi:MAG: 50S ribosomal protein L4 [Candidatus Sungbacteria bacterium RIFCSPLOWO2_01_FULL_59_16]|uniref:Large ribosomal subunit protein uL4 n=1 Tax=Candidatus Sungbacteria bacterium RIFCSPLOWO2_01_FULL_59_16 TaxID=1802280 RepID=A0A1G2LDU9_9BACT|nr:MAG: 50S ribosomal protein L4 [Candidatus Sungbacteria bacterium RIFCSPLOWO2_01_FULL_59_16]
MEVEVYNQQGKSIGSMELPKVFELPWNADLVHQVVTSQMANRRPVVAHAKGRGEVRGGGRKPWRQKGTGRARHGSIRSPIWKGGGVTHGPRKEKIFKRKINKKMAARALATVFAAKARDQELLVTEGLAFPKSKAKEAAKMFSHFAKVKAFRDIVGKEPRALVLLPGASPEMRRTLRNLPYLELVEARNVTAIDALNRRYIVAPKASIEILAKRLGS